MWVKNAKKIGWQHPCLFSGFYGVKEIGVFKNWVSYTQKIKTNFLSNLWTCANLYSADNTNSLLDFLTWMESR